MKKVKIMLLSLVVLAVAGGALAFKAKFDETYCTTTPRLDAQNNLTCKDAFGAALTCPTTIEAVETLATGITTVCTTDPVISTNGELTCTGRACISTRTFRISDDD